MTIKKTIMMALLVWGLMSCSKSSDSTTTDSTTTPSTSTTVPAAPPPSTPAASGGQEGSGQMRLSRDPFRRYVGIASGRSIVRAESPDLSDIPLEKLHYVGFVTSDEENLALLEDGGGHGYTARLGAVLDRGAGVITAIEPTQVVVKVTRKDSSGHLSTKSLQLPFSGR